MSDADRKKLRATTSPYMSAGGRGLLLTLIGGVSMVICFEWKSSRDQAKNKALLQNPNAGMPQNGMPPGFMPKPEAMNQPASDGTTGQPSSSVPPSTTSGSAAGTGNVSSSPSRPKTPQFRRTEFSKTNKPSVNTVVVFEIDGKLELFMVQKLLPDDRVEIRRMIKEGDRQIFGNSMEADVGQLRGALPEELM